MTNFNSIYDVFLANVTDDMYMELTKQDTEQLLQDLLISAIPWFEFPRQSLDYDVSAGSFVNDLTTEEINILATYMVMLWIQQQLASVENTRMKYSGSDFKFTSQANHMAKLQAMEKEFERKGFHLQRLYKRRIIDEHGVPRSSFSTLMSEN